MKKMHQKSLLNSESLSCVSNNELPDKELAQTENMGTALEWFIGSGIDEATLAALEEEDKAQKTLAANRII